MNDTYFLEDFPLSTEATSLQLNNVKKLKYNTFFDREFKTDIKNNIALNLSCIVIQTKRILDLIDINNPKNEQSKTNSFNEMKIAHAFNTDLVTFSESYKYLIYCITEPPIFVNERLEKFATVDMEIASNIVNRPQLQSNTSQIPVAEPTNDLSNVAVPLEEPYYGNVYRRGTMITDGQYSELPRATSIGGRKTRRPRRRLRCRKTYRRR
jgi:hypothetical protein